MKTTISIQKNIYNEIKAQAHKNSMTPSQLMRQLWENHKKRIRCDTPGCRPNASTGNEKVQKI